MTSLTEPKSGDETVFLVDDDAAVLTAVGRVLRSAGMRTAAFESAPRFLEELERVRDVGMAVGAGLGGCLVLDMAMPGFNGMEVQEAMVSRGISLPIVFLTGRADVPMTVRAMKGGAMDFLTKPVDDTLLIHTVARALEQDRRGRAERNRDHGVRQSLSMLTPREREVMDRVVAGLLNKQIALDLGTAEKTVKVHRGRVMAKMGANSVADLVRMAQRADPRSTL